MSSTSTDAKGKTQNKERKEKESRKVTNFSECFLHSNKEPSNKGKSPAMIRICFSYILFKTIIYTIYSGIKYKFMYFDFLNGLVSYIVTTLLAIRLSTVNFMKLLSKM